MKTPEELVDELWFCDRSRHVYRSAAAPKKDLGPRRAGVYAQRVEASDMKLRIAASALIQLEETLGPLEHGEFIYFDDRSRLCAQAGIESLVVFLRAALDTGISAYSLYFSERHRVESINDFFKHLQKHEGWIPPESLPLWEALRGEYAQTEFRWIHALVGREKGMSLRDLVVHRSALQLDTMIDSRDRGSFVLVLDNENIGTARLSARSFFDGVSGVLEAIVDDIERTDAAVPVTVPNSDSSDQSK